MKTDQESLEFWEYYFNKFDQVYIQPVIFAQFTVTLLIIFLLRFDMLFRIEKSKVKSKNDTSISNIILYIGGHCIIEFFIAFLICFCMIKLTNADPMNYVINLVAGPALGTVAAIFIDNKFIIPIETATGIGNVFKKQKDKDKDKKDNSENNITININNGDVQTPAPEQPILGNPNGPSLLSEDIADSDDFNKETIHAINNIKKENSAQTSIIEKIQAEQQEQREKLEDNSKKIESIIGDISILKESEMINKKIELKQMIYYCLNKGYATPEENDKIELYYRSYQALGGNHEIESLYKNHYLKLDIYDDTFSHANISITPAKYIDNATVKVVSDNSTNTDNNMARRLYAYGEFDEEYCDDGTDEITIRS